MLDLDVAECAFFLDFDGTLAPIVARPELAGPAPETLAALERLRAICGGAVAVLSGRALADLDAKLAPLVLPASGSHGAERRDAEGRRYDAEGPAALARATAALTAFAEPRGLLVERKPAGAALHFRAAPEHEAAARATADAAREEGLRVIHGHMVAEVALAGTTKGAALRAFMAEPPFAGRRPVAAGDDTTDEDAIAAAQEMGGVGVRIGPGESAARYRAPDIGTFLGWLHGAAGVAA